MTLTPIHRIMDNALSDVIAELYGERIYERKYVSNERAASILKPLIDIIQSNADELMLVCVYRNTPIFYGDRNPSSQYSSLTTYWPDPRPFAEEKFLCAMIGRVQHTSFDEQGKQMQIHTERYARFTPEQGYWKLHAGNIRLDTESLMQTYAAPQRDIHRGTITPEGLISYCFAFGQEVDWIFRLPHNAFWGLLSQPSAGWYPARPDRFRVMHEFITGTLDMDAEVSKRKAQDPFAFLE